MSKQLPVGHVITAQDIENMALHEQTLQNRIAELDDLVARLAAFYRQCGDLLAKLRKLEPEGTPAPWMEVAESGAWWIMGDIDNPDGNHPTVVYTYWNNRQEMQQFDIDLVVPLRNALPQILTGLEPVEAWMKAWDMPVTGGNGESVPD